MTEQLKPCPFCDGAAHFFKITDLDDKNFGGEGICCGSCPITTDLMFPLMEDCKPKLAEAWNRRAQPAQAVPSDVVRDAPPGYALVPVEVLKAASESLGSFVSDHGWADADMQTMDNIDAILAQTKGGQHD